MDGIDKVIHAILFGAEAFLLVWAASRNHFMSAALILGWCFILGGGLELVQFYFVEGRNGDFLDLLADMVGAVLGYALYSYLVRK